KSLAKRPKYSKLSSEKIENLLGEKIPNWKNAIDRFLKEMEFELE
ncbi:sugar nucleotide-binding protein, partial [Fusobacterium polymorphum]